MQRFCNTEIKSLECIILATNKLKSPTSSHQTYWTSITTMLKPSTYKTHLQITKSNSQRHDEQCQANIITLNNITSPLPHALYNLCYDNFPHCNNIKIIFYCPIKCAPQDTFVPTDNLKSMYLINNHIRHPLSQHDHPDKLFISAIVNHIIQFTHIIRILKVKYILE